MKYKMNKFTLLRAGISRNPQGRVLNREQMKHFWEDMGYADFHGFFVMVLFFKTQLKDQFCQLFLTSLRAKMCANDVPLSFGWSSADLRLAS